MNILSLLVISNKIFVGKVTKIKAKDARKVHWLFTMKHKFNILNQCFNEFPNNEQIKQLEICIVLFL